MTISDDEGGQWQYSRAQDANGDIVIAKLSAEANLTTYRDHTDSTRAYTSTITDPTGAQTRYSRSADGLTVRQALSCGMSLFYHYDLDAEYKFEFIRQIIRLTLLIH